MAQIVGAVVSGIVYTEEIVLHVGICAILVGVIEGSKQTKRATVEIPSVRQTCGKLEVAYRITAFYTPVIVESVAAKVVEIVTDLTACIIKQRTQRGVDASLQTAQAIVESKKVGGRAFAVRETLECGRSVPVATDRKG